MAEENARQVSAWNAVFEAIGQAAEESSTADHRPQITVLPGGRGAGCKPPKRLPRQLRGM